MLINQHQTSDEAHHAGSQWIQSPSTAYTSPIYIPLYSAELFPGFPYKRLSKQILVAERLS